MGDMTMFPMWARARRVRLVGHAISLREPAAAERCWRREVSAIAIDGMMLGISADEIQREIDGFAEAVKQEIRRLHAIYESEKEAAAQTAEIVVFGAPPKFRAEGEEGRKGGLGGAARAPHVQSNLLGGDAV